VSYEFSYPTPTPTLTPTPSPTPTPVDLPPLTCEPAVPQVLAWIAEHMNGGTQPSADDVVMVEVGPGDNPDEIWSVVAFRGSYNSVPRIWSYLTDAPSVSKAVGALWIEIGPRDWGAVSWTGDRLARGQAALALAGSCLPPA